MNKEVRLTLRQVNNRIILSAVDENGEHLAQGNILELTANGSILRYRGVSHTIGLQIGTDGRIIDETSVEGEGLDE